MSITDVPFAVLRFQYRFARGPLQLIEERVVTRLDAESPTRLFYERSLGLLDATVGSLLGDPELQERGSALAERSDALGRAARLDAVATQKEEHAEADLKAKQDEAIEDQQQAHEAKEREVTEAKADADAQKRAAVDAAAKRTAAVKKQADDAAARRTSAIEDEKRAEQAEIGAAEQTITAAAESKLDDAQSKRGVAASKRAQADRVEQLADAEKQKRTTERATNA